MNKSGTKKSIVINSANRKSGLTPEAGLEPETLGLKVPRSTN